MKKLIILIALISVLAVSLRFYKDYQQEIKPEIKPSQESSSKILPIKTGDLPAEEGSLPENPASDSSKTGKDQLIIPGQNSPTPFAIMKKSLEKDFASWPLKRCPDFWLLNEMMLKKNLLNASQVCVDTQSRPFPNHFRLFFSWCLIKLRFVQWLSLPDERLETQIRASLKKATEGAPSRLFNLNFKLGVGFVASLTQFDDFPQRHDILASAAESLEKMISENEKFPEIFFSELEYIDNYYERLRVRATQMIPQPPFMSEYAAVDYLVEEKKMIPNQFFFAEESRTQTVRNIEEKWLLSQIPLAFGRPFLFYRNYWNCPFFFGFFIDSNVPSLFQKSDVMAEVWSDYFLTDPDEFARLGEIIKTLELEIGK